MKTGLLFKVLKFIVVSILLLSFTAVNAQYLRVLDPRNFWWGPQGTIDSAVFYIEPKGVYAQVEMYLQFSARNTYFSPEDTLEVQMGFTLPEGTIVNDSWLLINEKWEKALILDRWTATSIYEGIVQRRRDPSILVKDSHNQYSLNIFPMAALDNRKAKISFLVPFKYSTSKALLQLPFDLLRLSSNPVKNVDLYIKAEMGYENPDIDDFPVAQHGSYKKIEGLNSQSSGALYFDTPMENGLYISNYKENKEGIYQIAYLPSKVIDIDNSKKILILVNHENTGNILWTDITSGLKDVIKNTLGDKDSFNIIFSGLTPKKLSDRWVSSDSAVVDSLFSKIGKTYYSGYSDLVSLFSNGLTFAKNDKKASILLISNSSEFNTLNKSNAFIEDLKKNFSPLPGITVFDYDFSYYGFWAGGNYFYGNTYLYGVLARSTGGSYYKLPNDQLFTSGLISTAQNIGVYIPIFDLAVTLENGFSFGRMDVQNSGSSVYAHKPVVFVGKYYGSLPLEIHVSGYVNDTVFSGSITVNDSISYTADSVSKTIWAGKYIEEMETVSNLNNDEISKVIDFSIESRVLSRYTAFLTLEPGVVIEPCEECGEGDGQFPTTVVENADNNDRIEILGNPFKDQLNIRLSFEQELKKDLNVQIFNAMGQLVRTVILQANSNYYEVSWDGKDQNGKEVAKGTYFIKFASGNYFKTVKVMKY